MHNPYNRRPPDWWDDLVIPTQEPRPFDVLAAIAPLPEEHDYVLYTDGSGHSQGWGAYAAIAKYSPTGEHIIRASGNYGSTVQRNELSAFLDGMHAIADHQLRRVIQLGLREVAPKNAWNTFVGDDRITVLWYTDRQNLAKALLYDEDQRPLNGRNNERDLWLRYSSMSKHFCVTPFQVPRNSVPAQAVCDEMCTIARSAMLQALPHFQNITPQQIHTPDQWNLPKPQNALL